MPNWKELLDEVKANGSPHDVLRRKYLCKLSERTGRNTIVYYSGWLQKGDLQKQGISGFAISDADKNGFMTSIHGMDRAKGLDLLLHTPGGDAAATESLVDYLRAMFGTDIRVIVPQIAMSAGTMIACAAREIVMGKHSSLGPIDPQIGGLPAHGIIEEFTRAAEEVRQDQTLVFRWQPIIAKYSPTLIGECEKAMRWANQMVKDWLTSGMFADQDKPAEKAQRVVDELGNHALTLSHARHISMQRAREIGLNVTCIEDDDLLQDAVLSVHHACIHTLTETAALKIIENQKGVAFISSIHSIQVPRAPF